MSTIILLEDEPLLRELYSLQLRRAGHHVVSAGNSRAIVDLAHEHQPDLVISDLIMPDYEGMEGIFRLRKVCGAPVIAISANPVFLKMASSVVSATLLKPFSGDELMLTVERVLNGSLADAAP